MMDADPDDNRVLECALKAGSDTLVTGDTDLLVMGSFRGITIQKPSDVTCPPPERWGAGSFEIDFWYRYGDSNPGPVAENHVS